MTTEAEEPYCISLEAAAKILGCSAEHVRRMAIKGEDNFGAYRFGHRWLVVRHVLKEYIDAQPRITPTEQVA